MVDTALDEEADADADEEVELVDEETDDVIVVSVVEEGAALDDVELVRLVLDAATELVELLIVEVDATLELELELLSVLELTVELEVAELKVFDEAVEDDAVVELGAEEVLVRLVLLLLICDPDELDVAVAESVLDVLEATTLAELVLVLPDVDESVAVDVVELNVTVLRVLLDERVELEVDDRASELLLLTLLDGATELVVDDATEVEDEAATNLAPMLDTEDVDTEEELTADVDVTLLVLGSELELVEAELVESVLVVETATEEEADEEDEPVVEDDVEATSLAPHTPLLMAAPTELLRKLRPFEITVVLLEPGQETALAEALAEVETLDEVPVVEPELVADPEVVLVLSVDVDAVDAVDEREDDEDEDDELDVTSLAPKTPLLATLAPTDDFRLFDTTVVLFEAGQETAVAEVLAEEVPVDVRVDETEPVPVLSVVVEADTVDEEEDELEVTSFAPHTPLLLTAAPTDDLSSKVYSHSIVKFFDPDATMVLFDAGQETPVEEELEPVDVAEEPALVDEEVDATHDVFW
ncbi:hypothetical protein LTR85_002857 [Meristemomyces frigidus]|nr:hypothetical protein LTR85_002857 [Meristemomyces frigidus]